MTLPVVTGSSGSNLEKVDYEI